MVYTVYYTVDIYSNSLPDHFRCSDFGHSWCLGPPGPMGSPDKEEDIIVTRETFFDPPPLNEKYKEPPAKVRHPKLCKETPNVQLSDPVTVTSEFQNDKLVDSKPKSTAFLQIVSQNKDLP